MRGYFEGSYRAPSIEGLPLRLHKRITMNPILLVSIFWAWQASRSNPFDRLFLGAPAPYGNPFMEP